LALWYLEQNPKTAMPLLRDAGKTTDLNIGAEIIGLLSAQATLTDTAISVEAHEALKEIAGGSQSVTAVSQLAINALDGIADRQELLALQALTELNARIGDLRLNINGQKQNEISPSSLILRVDDNFKGKDEHLRMFRFLRSVDTAYLEGPTVNEKMVREVLSMPALKRLVLKGPAITTEMLQVIFDLRELEHLEVIYAPIDDSSIETLVDLPLVGSLRLFGTKISRDGATRLKKELDGLDVYVGRGGFLGVQTSQSDLRVSRVVSGSGAELGGIIEQDVITQINGKPIKIFDQLRAELANFAPGEKVTVVVVRRGQVRMDRKDDEKKNEPEMLTLEVVLGVQEAQSN
jgi:hypothetical protein